MSDNEPNGATNSLVGCMAIILGVALVFGGAALWDWVSVQMHWGKYSATSGSPARAMSTSATHKHAETSSTGLRRISGNGWIGCKDKAILEKMVRFSMQKDQEAFQKEGLLGLTTGVCIPFRDGEPVYVEDSSGWGSLLKIRRKGDTEEYWILREAVGESSP